MKLFLPFLLLLLTLPSFLLAQTSKTALFLGNSYTAVNNLPQMVEDIAISLGDTLIHDQNTPGGHTLEGHSTNATSISKINSQNWDYVILQDQSQRPSFSPGQVAAEVYPFAASLASTIKTNDSCSMVMFYMTWGRKNGDQSNCANYPPICTYAGMQQRLRTSYLYMAQQHGEVAPVGAAWRLTRSLNPGIELYAPDESHPSLAGTYLAACTFYASIFHNSPNGAFIPPGLDSTDAGYLQENARKVVLDSLPNWYIDTGMVQANFTYFLSSPNNEITFVNASSSGTTSFWDFGDTTSSTTSSPIHTFLLDGTYIVSLIVQRDCQTDTFIDTLHLTSLAINDFQKTGFELYPNPAQNELNLKWEHSQRFDIAEIKDVQGRILDRIALNGNQQRIDLNNLNKGFYIITLSGKPGTISKKFLLK